MSIHIAMTWFLANLLHPVVLMLYAGGASVEISGEAFQAWFLFSIYSLLLSLPALLVSFLAGDLIKKMRTESGTKFITWLVVAPLIVMPNLMLIMLLFSGTMETDALNLAVPAMIAVVLTILVRFNFFFKALYKSETTELILEGQENAERNENEK